MILSESPPSIGYFTIALPVLGTVAVAFITGWFGLRQSRYTREAKRAEEAAGTHADEANKAKTAVSEWAALAEAQEKRLAFLEHENDRLRTEIEECQESARSWNLMQKDYDRRIEELERRTSESAS